MGTVGNGDFWSSHGLSRLSGFYCICYHCYIVLNTVFLFYIIMNTVFLFYIIMNTVFLFYIIMNTVFLFYIIMNTVFLYNVRTFTKLARFLLVCCNESEIMKRKKDYRGVHTHSEGEHIGLITMRPHTLNKGENKELILWETTHGKVKINNCLYMYEPPHT